MLTKNNFDIKFIYLAYVPPYHDEDQPYEIKTLLLRTNNKATEYLHNIFDAALNDGRIEISFTADDQQGNPFRENLINILNKSDNAQKKYHADKIAEKLYEVTDERNGTGLLVIIEGEKAKSKRLVIVRFKGDEGLYNHGKSLKIDYLPEVFTKKSKHYKLAVFEDILTSKSFWKGHAVDKQISTNMHKQISDFWVSDFLSCKPAITSLQGTIQFSKIIKAVLVKTSDVEEQEAIISGVTNLKSKNVKRISLNDFCNSYLPQELTERIKSETKDDSFFNTVFDLEKDTYRKEFGKTVLSLVNGITAYIPSFNYDKYVTEEDVNGKKEITIRGRLASKKLNTEIKSEKTAKSVQ